MEVKKLNTPCFIFEEEAFRQNISDFHEALEVFFPKSIIGYSFKTNSLPYVISVARECGCYAEVVSDTEYELAVRMGYVPKHIIFNGPVKGKEKFQEAFRNGSILNVDSSRELEWLRELSEKGNIGKVGVRVNLDMEAILPGQTAMGAEGGRFGFCEENGELGRVISEIENIEGMKVVGLHLHISSKTKSIEIYRNLVQRACEIAKKNHLELEYMDIGGGFFGGGDDGQAYQNYMEAVYHILKQNQMEKLTVIVEPGASVIATAIDYVTTVIDVKETNRNRFVVTDGSRLHVDPFFHKEGYAYTVQPTGKNTCEKQVICGYTCMEKDRFMKLMGEKEFQVGDSIIYHVVGAYTMCFNPLFIEYLPSVYRIIKGGYEMIRGKWTVDEYLQKCDWKA